MTGYEFLDMYCIDEARNNIVDNIPELKLERDIELTYGYDENNLPVTVENQHIFEDMSWEEQILLSIIYNITHTTTIIIIDGEVLTDGSFYVKPTLVKCILKNYLTWDKIIKFLSDGTSN